MPRVKLPEHKKRSHFIKLSLNDHEYAKCQILKNRLSSSSPTLSLNEFLRQCILKHDGNDYAILKYFGIELNNTVFISDFAKKRKYNKKD
jgi:hypothetical protein